jgi:hypothetical protein
VFENAEAYERFMGRWSWLVARGLLERVHVDDASKVLDVGSGTGSLSRAICERSPTARVVGIDPSKEFVEYSASESPWRDRMRFEEGDAQQLLFENASFDVALSLLVLNFIPDPQRHYWKFAGSPGPGAPSLPQSGTTAVKWGCCGRFGMLRAPSIAMRTGSTRRICGCAGGASWQPCGRRVASKVFAKKPSKSVCGFTTFAGFWEPFLLGQGPAGSYVRRLSPGQLEALRGELENRLDFSAGTLLLPARAWMACGIVPL